MKLGTYRFSRVWFDQGVRSFLWLFVIMVEGSKLFSKLPFFSGDGKGWQAWKRRFYAVLDFSGMLKGLTEERRPGGAPEGADEPTVASARKAQEDWDKRNRDIYNVLSYYTESSAASLVLQFEGSRDGRQAWLKLFEQI